MTLPPFTLAPGTLPPSKRTITIIYKAQEWFVKKYRRDDQISMAILAADCAKQVLPYFERAYLEDDRPRHVLSRRGWRHVRQGTHRGSQSF
ncbi:putative immunity protein [Methanofollis sp. W23]|uniref:putative immunity protein n=1 Tax=Methanofollis sp. W23 TaxID=2817849 RepID=UPI0032AED36C